MTVDLALLEADMLEALEQPGQPFYTTAQLALACRLELPRTVSILNTLRRLGLANRHVAGLGAETRWKITELGREARRSYLERKVA